MFSRYGQPNDEGGSFARGATAFYPDFAAMCFYDQFAVGQAEASAFAPCSFGDALLEFLEEAFLCVWRNAWAGVANANEYGGWGGVILFGSQVDTAVIRRKLNGIV